MAERRLGTIVLVAALAVPVCQCLFSKAYRVLAFVGLGTSVVWTGRLAIRARESDESEPYLTPYDAKDSPLQAFEQPTADELAAGLDGDGDGELSVKELQNFLKRFNEQVENHPDLERLTAEEMLQAVTGDPSSTSISCKAFAQFLEDVGPKLGSTNWYNLLHWLKYDQEVSTMSGWLWKKARGKYYQLRCKLQGHSYRVRHNKQIMEQRQQETLAAARARARVQEVKARARTCPERPTDFEVEVSTKVTHEFSFVEMKVGISNGDTLDDVYSRFLLSSVAEVPASMPKMRATLYAGEHQPSWLAVKKGWPRWPQARVAYSVKNFDLTVAELNLTSEDQLIFCTPYVGEVQTFGSKQFVLKHDALRTAPNEQGLPA